MLYVMFRRSAIEARTRNTELPAESCGEGALAFIAVLRSHLKHRHAFGQSFQREKQARLIPVTTSPVAHGYRTASQ